MAFPISRWRRTSSNGGFEQLRAEGVRFVTGVNIGGAGPMIFPSKTFGGSRMRYCWPAARSCRADWEFRAASCGVSTLRWNILPRRTGVALAMSVIRRRRSLADGKHVIIIGGGDTGADCLGTAHRQRAKSVRQFQIHEMPPEERSPKTPWPMWPIMLRSEGAHEEGGIREWNVRTTGFSGDEAWPCAKTPWRAAWAGAGLRSG